MYHRFRRHRHYHLSTLTAYLMMGNLSSALQQQAVSMFEVGKVPHAQLGLLVEALQKVVHSRTLSHEKLRPGRA